IVPKIGISIVKGQRHHWLRDVFGSNAVLQPFERYTFSIRCQPARLPLECLWVYVAIVEATTKIADLRYPVIAENASALHGGGPIQRRGCSGSATRDILQDIF